MKWLFRGGQLYVVVPNLFAHSHISDTGKIAHVEISNQSMRSESDVEITLDNSMRYELVASTESEIELNANIILVKKFAPRTKIAIVLAVEGDEFSDESVRSFRSEDTKGKVVSKTGDIPPNRGIVLVGFLLGVALISLPIVTYESVKFLKLKKGVQKLEHYYSRGWSGLDSFIDSDLRKSYAPNEFPIEFVGAQIEKNRHTYKFLLTNKSVFRLSTTAFVYAVSSGRRLDSSVRNSEPKADELESFRSYIAQISTDPGQSSDLFVVVEPHDPENAEPYLIKFSISNGEFIHGLSFSPTKICESSDNFQIKLDECSTLLRP